MRPRRGSALLVATVMVLQACEPGPAPSGSAASSAVATPAASPGAAASAPACGVTPSIPGAPWRDRVFYEIFVRSFADSDGDGIGDLAGATARLDYLNDGDPNTTQDLGVTGIWLMPVAEAVSYHGYDVTDYAAVEPDYGDRAAMQAFVEAAHARGILVIVDFVINHTSRDHPWFRDALDGGAHRDWYIWSPDDPGWPSVAGPNPWHRTAAGDYYYGAFWEGMPDLNLGNPEVTEELVNVARTWLDEIGVDGFRIDAAKHLIETGRDSQINTRETKAWLARFRDAIDTTHPDALVLGEVYDGRAVTTSYIADGALDMVFDFGIGPALTTGVYGDVSTVQASQREIAERYAAGAAGTFLSNHDQPRVMTALRGDVDAAREAAAVLLTGPGVPFLYYGEELGMTGTKPDEQIRTPFPWTAEAPGHGFTEGVPWEPFTAEAPTANVAVQDADPGSLLAAYRWLVQLRGAHEALAAGSWARVEASSRTVAASVRAAGAERLLLLHNLSREPASAVSLDLDAGPLCGTPGAELLHATNGSPGAPAAPIISAAGGLSDYVPLPELPARSTVVIDISG